MRSVDEESCGAKSDPSGDGMTTDPPPRSCATRIVYAFEPILPVLRMPHRGEVIVRVYTACTGVLNNSLPSRKNGRFSE